MNELTTDLKSLHEATLNNLKSSKANNTLRAYKSDFKDFGAFCAKHGLNSLPTEPKIVSIYLTHLSKNSKISTLRRRLVSIIRAIECPFLISSKIFLVPDLPFLI